jgi:hypothetical protein
MHSFGILERIRKLLSESPLPGDWDAAVFDRRIPFKDRIYYAKERATKIGIGTARVVFQIPYEGRDTVLKVAMNVKGLAQNRAEVSFYNHSYVKRSPLFIPMIDYDKANKNPTWVHFEFGEFMLDSEFKAFFGIPVSNMNTITPNHIHHSNKYQREYADFLIQYKPTRKERSDHTLIGNWAIYKNRPVIIDSGLNDDVWDKHYDWRGQKDRKEKIRNKKYAFSQNLYIESKQSQSQGQISTEKNLLESPPLPDHWNSDIYNERIPFKTRIEYAKQRAATLGTGSARVAFEIPYQNRQTVLKIAKNKKGIAQNVVELNFYDDRIIREYGLFVPLIDHDKNNRNPTWLHFEKAEQMTPKMFRNFFGVDAINLTNAMIKYTKGRKLSEIEQSVIENSNTNEYIYKFMSYIGDYDPSDAVASDYRNIKNWGIYQGNPVIIDAGLDDEVHEKYYNTSI